MRTPLGRVRGLGSAREGTGHFWTQRLTGVSNLFLTLFFVGFVATYAGRPYVEVAGALSNPVVAVVLLAMMLSIAYHMKLGMQIVIEDYVHGEFAKLIWIGLNIFFAVLIGLASAFALLKLAFGS
ncbi:succinate dehydrogenase, hydrophobic membrane anchor protein [Limoniibacter endophyticus]|uniref:Succinate dehydrogenase hydrophobic membrane anchor subunit n=2 Tax=Limoniibacter endophyticus TaxID=1565040 RepID=A0A8J3DI58_9HYPH|nr:succinate dehydrogenase, hydrophobic membrane anchor protein [Limoniibacter endophyticus]